MELASISAMSEPTEPLDPEPALLAKVKQDSPDTDTVAKDIKSRLSLQLQSTSTEAASSRQTNGLHQVNGICDSPPRSPEALSIDFQADNTTVETSHVNQSGKSCWAIRTTWKA